MNALKVITLAAVAACGSTSLVGYNTLAHHGLHGYSGLNGYSGLHGYSSLQGYAGNLGYTAAAPVAYSGAVAPAYNNYAAAAPVAYSGAVAPAYKTYAAAAPVAYSGAVAPAYNNYAAPYSPIQTQYHSQDELGQYSFGYSGGPSDRAETRDAYGNVRGHYNYIDSNGQVQTTHYVADALGFRVSGTNLPVGPDAPATVALVAPVQVEDTPEVVKAREEFLALYNEAAAAAASAPDTRKKRSVGSVGSVAVHSAVSPLAYSGLHHGYHGLHSTVTPAAYSGIHRGYNGLLGHHGLIGHHAGYAGLGLHHARYTGLGLHSPAATYAGLPALGYATAPAVAPAAVHDAELLRVENNPGHAVSYRVY